MHIFLDGKAVEADGWTIRTVGELVQHLGNLPEFKHRIVQSIAVGGLELHVWEGNSAVALPQDAQIHVKTQSVAEVMASAVQSAREYLPRLDAGGVQAATLLQEGREQEAFSLVGQLVEGLQWYSEFLGNVATLIPQEERWASERLTALSNVLEQLLQSWESHDHTLLADLLEYELPPELQRGLEYVEALSQSNLTDVEHLE